MSYRSHSSLTSSPLVDVEHFVHVWHETSRCEEEVMPSFWLALYSSMFDNSNPYAVVYEEEGRRERGRRSR